MARIAVVEDDAAYRYAVGRALQAAGYETLSFESGTDLLKAKARPDVLVTDLRLPAGTPNGVELARMLTAQHPDLKVVYMTAFSHVAGVDPLSLPSVVFKDGDLGRVVAAIEEALV